MRTPRRGADSFVGDDGFSIVELLIVVAIIAILASLGTLGAFHLFRSAGESQATSDLRALMGAITTYYTVHRRYPPSSVNGDIQTLQDALQNDSRAADSSCASIRQDPWGQRYIYIDANNYGDPSSVDVEGDNYNPGSYDLYSPGPNGSAGGSPFSAEGTYDKHNVNNDNIRADVSKGRVIKGYGKQNVF